MSGVIVKVEGKLPAPENVAQQAEGLVHTMANHPAESLLLFICVIIVLILMPGGVGPSFVKYGGAKRRQEQIRSGDVKQITEQLGKRAKRRKRGKAKGKKK
ncbi:hypothetical protein A8B75_18700 [Sphingomonadales bacterium EhC05]|nr:hypothetical protein A8B75_18700 [Sphingomonadales bacterium EhC05]